jgi:hypothetical protein
MSGSLAAGFPAAAVRAAPEPGGTVSGQSLAEAGAGAGWAGVVRSSAAARDGRT